jgi:hypothetical protein
MNKALHPTELKQTADAMDRAKDLAGRMASVLGDEDAADVSLAVAFLTSGVVHQYADNLSVARHLVSSMRQLEDLMIESAFHDQSPLQ